jgi:hypothetical protein
MNQRRTDEDTGMTVEYAWFLADTRGVGFALEYLDNCHVPRALVTRALDRPDLRRTHERRGAPRPCACNGAAQGGEPPALN